MRRFFLPSLAIMLAADNPGGGGSAKAPSLDAQLTAATEKLGAFATKENDWNTERAMITGARDTALSRVTELEGQLSTITGERDTAQASVTTLQGQLATANGQIATLTTERDAAKALAANPSAQAAAILATVGVPAVATKTNASGNPAATKADVSGLTGLGKAIALHQAAQTGK